MERLGRLVTCLVGAIAVLSGCDGKSSGTEPRVELELFRRYVALGNSITAGVQSDGINDSTQMHAYPVLVAGRADAQFAFARLQKPGCAPPLLRPFPVSAARVGGSAELSCAGLAGSRPAINQNLAFPGFKIADALALPTDVLVRAIYTQIFGSRTAVQAMTEADPSLVSVWLGNNDVLGAVTNGNVGTLTSLASFETSLDAIVEAIKQTRAQDAVLIGVLDPQVALSFSPARFSGSPSRTRRSARSSSSR